MIELKNIYKSYCINKNKQSILKNINLSFNDNSLVAILGPSGSGKTTLLNIIGGLDKPDSGEIIINGKNTSNFSERDLDYYRNKEVGFVFQNYNLINHLSVFENVKLASIISKTHKKLINKQVINILKKVGLENHFNKKPNQLSGGEQQRVCIARALVNNPSIIVADEPTGALDIKTSDEIMKLLKVISNDKLVLLVTHNTDLAKKYASSIIHIEDGCIKEKFSIKSNECLNLVKHRKSKVSIPFITSILIGISNLFTKKKRTILMSFASSIGIIGIGLVLSLSNGVNKYIRNVEKSSIGSYPILIERNVVNIFGENVKNKTSCKKGRICISETVDSELIKNDLIGFKKYIEGNVDFKKLTSNISYSYDIDLYIFSKSYKRINDDLFFELKNNDYELLYGNMPRKYNELVIIVNDDNFISKDLLSYINQEELKENEYNYKEFINKSFKLILNTSIYNKSSKGYVNMINDSSYMKRTIDNGIDLNIVGIIKGSGNDSFLGYSSDLTRYIVENVSKTKLYKEQFNNKRINLLNNKYFDMYDNTYQSLEKKLGIYDLDNPTSISIYPNSYKSKEKIIELIDKYNKNGKSTIVYLDMMKVLVDNIGKILRIITSILIAFASISLFVSSIMISIITYINVLERTKEIGILRALGARKKDVKRIFHCETFIVGLLSGIIGVLITFVLSCFCSVVVHRMYGINAIAKLSFLNGLFLIILSIFTTVLSGMKPANKASKKNPVEALKGE